MRKYLFLPLTFLAMPLTAEPIRVAVDIAPIHSLVARVMHGVGAPDLIVAPDASPHSYALRPSQARALEKAQVVFWTSAELTPWLERPLETLASDALIAELMITQGSVQYAFRDDHEDHKEDHDHDEAHEEEKGHDHAEKHDDHDAHKGEKHDDEKHHDEHAHEKEHDHSDAEFDPHGWLDPSNASLWVHVIAETLSRADEQNAALYAQNARTAQAELSALSAQITAQMDPFKSAPYMVLHDGYQYFDRRFGPTYAGAIALGDAAAPSPARVASAREALEHSGASCVFKEPQQSDRLVQVVLEGSSANLGKLDAIGARLSPGPDLYPQLLQGLADNFVACLAD